MSEAYDIDVVAWSQRQAALLRRVAAGEKLNEAPDWPNIIEEIEDLGLSSLRAVRSHLLQAILHELKVRSWPGSRETPHWRSEVRLQRGQAADTFTPSMRQLIDVAAIYRRAVQALPDEIDGHTPLPPPPTCPWSLSDLLGEGDLPQHPSP